MAAGFLAAMGSEQTTSGAFCDRSYVIDHEYDNLFMIYIKMRYLSGFKKSGSPI